MSSIIPTPGPKNLRTGSCRQTHFARGQPSCQNSGLGALGTCVMYTLNYLGSGISAPLGAGTERSNMVS